MFTFKVPVWIFDTYIKFILEPNPEKVEDIFPEDLWGMTQKYPDWHCEIYMWDKEDLRTMVHELSHAVHWILEKRWIKDEEAFCYLLDFLVVKYKIKLDKLKKLWKNLKKNI
jgi:hypothetical protein